MSSSLRTAAALVAISAASMSCRGSRAKAGTRIQRKVDPGDGMMMTVGDGSAKLASMLYEMAMKKKEAVPVAQDMMRIRDENLKTDKEAIDEKAFDDALSRARRCLSLSPEEQEKMYGAAFANLGKPAPKMTNASAGWGPFQSSVVEKFVDFLGQKGKLGLLEAVATYYVDRLYARQGIAPVLVTSAAALSPEQKDAITAKMKVLTKSSDIKLVNKVNAGLVGGFKIEWNFMDVDLMTSPGNSIDKTFATLINDEAVKEGVMATA